MSHKPMDNPTPPPSVSPNICDPFSGEAGAEVYFQNVNAGTEINKVQSTDPWPFCKSDGTDFGPPIGPFPLPGAQKVYLKSNLTVNQSYRYNVTQACLNGVTKSVTIIEGALLKKPA